MAAPYIAIAASVASDMLGSSRDKEARGVDSIGRMLYSLPQSPAVTVSNSDARYQSWKSMVFCDGAEDTVEDDALRERELREQVRA